MTKTTSGAGGDLGGTGRQRTPPSPRRPYRVRRAVRRVLGLNAPGRERTVDVRADQAMWQVCGITPSATRGLGPLSRR